MAPRAAPKKPSSQELVELMSGPRVDIYVGSGKTHYSLPKRLLAYYSDYFEHCFNGGFVEGKTQKLYLDEDNVTYFDIMVDYMCCGTVSQRALLIPALGHRAALQKCMDFIDYTDKYGVGYISIAVYDALESILNEFAEINIHSEGTSIQPSNVETVFRAVAPGHPLRSLIARAALSTAGMTGDFFQKQEKECAGFAEEILAQMRMTFAAHGHTWVDPFSHRLRIN